ncbi:hypothetical protein ABK040_015234 [Willaertia magna]
MKKLKKLIGNKDKSDDKNKSTKQQGPKLIEYRFTSSSSSNNNNKTVNNKTIDNNSRKTSNDNNNEEEDYNNNDYDYEEEEEDDDSENEEEEEEDIYEKQLKYKEYSNMTSDELIHSLNKILNEISIDYRAKDFSYIDTIATSLSTKEPQKDLKRLKEAKIKLNDAIQQIVCVNYKGFNKSIKNFSDMLELLNKSNKDIQIMITKIKTAKEMLILRNQDLINLYSSFIQQFELMEILNQIEIIKNIPEMIQFDLKTKHFLHAVNLVTKNVILLNKKEQLKSVKALHDVRLAFNDYLEKLPEIIVDELRNQLHIVNLQKVLDLVDDLNDLEHLRVLPLIFGGENSLLNGLQNSLQSSLQKRQFNDSPNLLLSENNSPNLSPNLISSTTMIGMKKSLQNTLQNNLESDTLQNITKLKQKLQLNDDLNINYEKENPSYYILILIESLDKLNKLPELQSRLIQNFNYELKHLIEIHIKEFSKSLQNSDRNLLWLIIQNKRQFLNNFNNNDNNNNHYNNNIDDSLLDPMKTNVGRSLLQGKLISEMMNSLFIKLKKVLRNYQFIIYWLDLKRKVLLLSEQQENNQNDNDYNNNDYNNKDYKKTRQELLMEEESVNDWTNITLTKQVLTKIKDAIQIKVLELKNLTNLFNNNNNNSGDSTNSYWTSLFGSTTSGNNNNTNIVVSLDEDEKYVYISTLEDLLNNFIEKQINQSQFNNNLNNNSPNLGMSNNQMSNNNQNNNNSIFLKVQVLIQLFNTQMDLNEKSKKLKINSSDKLKIEFKTFLNNILSSKDTPNLLSIENVWNILQNELQQVMIELLGTNQMSTNDILLNNNSLMKQSQLINNSINSNTQNDSKKKKKTTFDFNIKFRFSANVTPNVNDLNNENVTNQDQNNKKKICDLINNYFIFNSYNILWLYQLIISFLQQSCFIMNQYHLSFLNLKNNLQLNNLQQNFQMTLQNSNLFDFLNQFIKRNFIPFIETDYRSKLTKLLNEQDKHNTNAFLPRESAQQRQRNNFSTVTNHLNNYNLNNHNLNNYNLNNDILMIIDNVNNNTHQRPLLNSVLFMDAWLKELLNIAIHLPFYKKEIFNIMEILLKQFLNACKLQFENVIGGKFIQQLLSGEYEQYVYPVLKSDPLFRKLYNFKNNNLQKNNLQNNNFYQKLFNLIDERLQMNYPHSLPKTKFIDNNSELILLANLNDSLEWLVERMLIYEKEIIFHFNNQQSSHQQSNQSSRMATPNVNNNNSGNSNNLHKSKTSPNILNLSGTSPNSLSPYLFDSNTFKRKSKILNHVESESDFNNTNNINNNNNNNTDMNDNNKINNNNGIDKLLIENNTLQLEDISFLSNFRKEYIQLSLKCLFSLKLDLRVHCYHFIHCNLMDNFLKYGTYDCEDERKEPEDFIHLFNQDLFRMERYLSYYLPKSKTCYLFDGIERMILDLFIGSLPFALDQYKEMRLPMLDNGDGNGNGGTVLLLPHNNSDSIFKAPKFTKLGLEKMMKNIFGLQQQLSNFAFVNQQKFQLIRDYFRLLELKHTELIDLINNTKSLKKLPFTEEQYEAILETEYNYRKLNVKDLELLRQVFKEKKIKKIKNNNESVSGGGNGTPTTSTTTITTATAAVKK